MCAPIALLAQEFLPPTDQDLQRGEFKRKHLSSPMLKEFIETHCILDPYKMEVYKGCWQLQLKALKAANGGNLPTDKVGCWDGTSSCRQ